MIVRIRLSLQVVAAALATSCYWEAMVVVGSRPFANFHANGHASPQPIVFCGRAWGLGKIEEPEGLLLRIVNLASLVTIQVTTFRNPV